MDGCPVDSMCHSVGTFNHIQVDNRSSSEPILTPAEAVKMCDRNFGIGADGVSFAHSVHIHNSYSTQMPMIRAFVQGNYFLIRTTHSLDI